MGASTNRRSERCAGAQRDRPRLRAPSTHRVASQLAKPAPETVAPRATGESSSCTWCWNALECLGSADSGGREFAAAPLTVLAELFAPA